MEPVLKIKMTQKPDPTGVLSQLRSWYSTVFIESPQGNNPKKHLYEGLLTSCWPQGMPLFSSGALVMTLLSARVEGPGLLQVDAWDPKLCSTGVCRRKTIWPSVARCNLRGSIATEVSSPLNLHSFPTHSVYLGHHGTIWDPKINPTWAYLKCSPLPTLDLLEK